MLPEAVRNLLLAVVAIVGGVVAASQAGRFTGTDGVIQPLITGAASPAGAGVAILVAAIAAAVGGRLLAAVSNPAVGFFGGGWAFFGLAWRMEPAETFVLAGGSLRQMTLEGLAWAIAAGGAAAVLLWHSGGLRDVEPTPSGDRPHPVFSTQALRGAAGALAALPVAWLIARTGSTGQALGAAILGGTGAGLAGRLLAPHVQPYLIVPATVLVGSLATGWTATRLGPDVSDVVRRSGLPPLATMHGAAWAAGAMIGTGMGLGWARTFLHHEDPPANDAAPPVRRVVRPPSVAAADDAATE